MAKTTIQTIENEINGNRKDIFRWMHYYSFIRAMYWVMSISLSVLLVVFLILYHNFVVEIKVGDIIYLLENNIYLMFGIYTVILAGFGLFFSYFFLLVRYKIKSVLMGHRAFFLKIGGESESETDEKIILVNHIREMDGFLLVWDLLSKNLFRIDLNENQIHESDFAVEPIECDPFFPDCMNFPTISMHVVVDPEYPHVFHCLKIYHQSTITPVETDEMGETEIIWPSKIMPHREVI